MSEKPATPTSKRPMGMRAFVIIWIGQIISILGSAMTGFAVTIWVYEGTEKATALALTAFFFVTPMLLLSPIAGAIVDRYDRKLMMMLSDLASGVTTIIVLILFATDNLEVWHLFITNAISGAFQTFQWPAYSAAMSLMLPKEQYGRANGMMELAGNGSRIFAPMLASALLVPLGLKGILIIDIVSFIFAVGSLLFVNIPEHEKKADEGEGQPEPSLLADSLFGFQYILQRPSLLGLQLVFMIGNFFVSIPFVVMAAMILARTGNDELALGSVQSAGAVGGVVGGLLMTAWGGPKRRIHGVLTGWALSGLVWAALLGIGRIPIIWMAAVFLGNLIIPILNGSNQAIWQTKVPPGLQGRVFSIRRLIAWFVNPISMLAAGPLADTVLEPAMQEGQPLADMFGWLVGTGPGAGMALVFVVGGGLAALVGLSGYAFSVIRKVESILPDHDSAQAADQAEPAPIQMTGRHKTLVAVGGAVMVAAILGLGWLQVQVMSAP